MKRKQKPMKITQLDTLRSVRKKMPRPTVRLEPKHRVNQKVTVKDALEENDDYMDDVYYLSLIHI